MTSDSERPRASDSQWTFVVTSGPSGPDDEPVLWTVEPLVQRNTDKRRGLVGALPTPRSRRSSGLAVGETGRRRNGCR